MELNPTLNSEAVITSASDVRRQLWPKRLYVPVVTLMLVLAAGYWLSRAAKVDPLTAAQNSRIKFKSGSDAASGAINQLSSDEAAQAEAILVKDRRILDENLKILYVGNSQTLAIMDERPGDLTTPQWFQVLLSRQAKSEQDRATVILGSEPNMTMPEVLIKLVAAAEQSPRQCDVLLEAAVLEEYRGLGIREDMLRLVQSHGIKAKLFEILNANSDLPAAATSLGAVVHNTEEQNGAERKAKDTFAQRLEARIQATAEKNSLFARRTDLQAQTGIQYSVWRNSLLGINSSTLRPVPESSYRASLELLELALRYARAKGINVVLYLAPMRSVQPNPNLPADVAKFRHDVPAICQRYEALCMDYIDLVPESLWTNYSDDPANAGGQRDFAHFTGAAHKLLAEKLISDVAPQIKRLQEQRPVAQR